MTGSRQSSIGDRIRLAGAVAIGLILAALWFGPLLATAARGAEVGQASFYQCCNPVTACGLPFRPDAVAVAHRNLPCGTRVRITDLKTGRSIVAPVTDRGPFVAGRIVDLTRGAARRLGVIRRGVTRVKLEVVR